MRFYKFIDDDGNITYQSHQEEVIHPNIIEIAQEEYENIVLELQKITENENTNDPTYEELLEKARAYDILMGVSE
jgi:hypothetical protein